MSGPLPPPAARPNGPHERDLVSWCEEWVRSPALQRLFEAFGFVDPGQASLKELCVFAGKTWDFRRRADGGSIERNRVRNQIEPDLEAVVETAARELGLIDATSPVVGTYDHVLILGGLIRASLVRPRLAASLIEAGLEARTVAGIGGYRHLNGDELALRDLAGIPEVTNEIEAMDCGLRSAFELKTNEVVDEGHFDPKDLNRSWLLRRYLRRLPPEVILVAAPSTEPENRRANTADTYKFWAENVVGLRSSDRVLIVTNAIYVPFQGVDALRMLALSYGCGIDVIGVKPEQSAPGVPAQTFSSSHYLQEINSTLRSIRFALEELA